MREGELIFFAPGYTVKKIKEEVLSNPVELLDAFKKRIYSYYIEPARVLPAFSQIIICCSMIDFLAKLKINTIQQVNDYREFYKNTFKINLQRKNNRIYMGERIICFLVNELRIFDYNKAYWFCEYVRNGLVHEGRIKCGCYLDNAIENVTEIKNGALLFNPKLILEELELWFKDYINSANKNDKIYEELHGYLKKLIDEDIIAMKKRSQSNMFPCRNME